MGDKDKPTCRIAQPINNENPVFISIFAFRLQQWLYAKYPHMRRFIEYGIDITARNEVLVCDVTHGIRHSALKTHPTARLTASPRLSSRTQRRTCRQRS